jgi:hypothetical protein
MCTYAVCVGLLMQWISVVLVCYKAQGAKRHPLQKSENSEDVCTTDTRHISYVANTRKSSCLCLCVCSQGKREMCQRHTNNWGLTSLSDNRNTHTHIPCQPHDTLLTPPPTTSHFSTHRPLPSPPPLSPNVCLTQFVSVCLHLCLSGGLSLVLVLLPSTRTMENFLVGIFKIDSFYWWDLWAHNCRVEELRRRV